MMIDEDIDPLDGDFPAPHLDPEEQNDIRWVGRDKVVVQNHRDYSVFARDFDFWRNDEVDYDPTIDNVDSDNFKETE